MRFNAEKVIASSGNQSLYPSGNPVFTNDGSPLVAPGQIVVFDPTRNLSLGNTVTPAANRRIAIGVGVGRNGARARSIRLGFGDAVWADGLLSVTSEPPRCGTPQVVDMLFRCSPSDTAFSVNIRVENDKTQNQYPFGKSGVWTHTVKSGTPPCDGCSTADYSREVACKLADAINQTNVTNNPLKTSTFYGTRSRELFYEAVALYQSSEVFCFNPVSGACSTECDAVSRVKALKISEGDAIEFTNSANPADSSQTLLEQLDNIVKQINEIFAESGDAKGHAVLTKGVGNCCPWRLEINHCLAIGEVTLLDDQDQAITPCATFSPLAAVPVVDNCPDCPVESSTTTYLAGVRLISKPKQLDYPRGKYPPNPAVGYYGQTISITGTEGFEDVFYRTVQEPTLPENLGYQWHAREYLGDITGGTGRDFERFHDLEGPLQLPRLGSPASNTIVDQFENYCSYNIAHRLPFTDGQPGTGVQGPRGITSILIPAGDSVTRSEFEALLNNYITSAAFGFQSVTCSGDQDQDAAYATGTLTLTGNAQADEEVVVGDQTYVWKDAPGAANEVDIGGSASASLDNLIAAINGTGTPGSTYGVGTQTVTGASAAAGAGDTMVVTADTAGVAGNSIVTTETMANGSWGAGTLTGGAESATPEVYPNANGFVI